VITDWNSKTPYYYLGLLMAVFCVARELRGEAEQARVLPAGHPRGPDAAHPWASRLTFYKNTALGSRRLHRADGSFAAFYVSFIEPQGVFGITSPSRWCSPASSAASAP